MDSETLTGQIREALTQSATPLICAYLYGSWARGEAGIASDVDVAVLLDEDTPKGLLGPLARLRGELERSLGREVDLVDLRTAPPDLIHRVLRDGILVIDNRPDERIAFEVAARNAYFDLLPYLQEYRRRGSA